MVRFFSPAFLKYFHPIHFIENDISPPFKESWESWESLNHLKNLIGTFIIFSHSHRNQNLFRIFRVSSIESLRNRLILSGISSEY